MTFNPLWATPISPFVKGRSGVPTCVNYEFSHISADCNAASPLYEGGDGRSPEGVKRHTCLNLMPSGYNLLQPCERGRCFYVRPLTFDRRFYFSSRSKAFLPGYGAN